MLCIKSNSKYFKLKRSVYIRLPMPSNSTNKVIGINTLKDYVCFFCEDNGLELNLIKYKIMTFTHIIANYYIKVELIERVEEIKDLGVTMGSKLSFTTQ